jgi:predicted  nucleic acid-binding Zn-ribbon protein
LGDICLSLSLHEVHFLKIDVEGAERAVLEGADFEKVRPWIVVVEATAPLSTERIEHLWEHILLQAGYQRAFFDGVNLYYVAQEHSELIETLAAPPNALDDFKPVRMAEAEAQLAHLSAELEARRRRQEELETLLEGLRREHTTQIAAASDQAEAHALETARQAKAHETELAERDRRISDLLSRSTHQASSATQKLAFTSRRLAQSRRRIIELEEHLHAQQHSLDSLNSLVSALKAEREAQTTRLGELEDRAARRMHALAAQYEMLTNEHRRLKEHRDALLISTSWRLSAPLRKAKTAFQIARSQPHLFLPLVAVNFRRRPRNSPDIGVGSTTHDQPLIIHQENVQILDYKIDQITEIPLSTNLDRHEKMILSIRDGIKKRRLPNQ